MNWCSSYLAVATQRTPEGGGWVGGCVAQHDLFRYRQTRGAKTRFPRQSAVRCAASRFGAVANLLTLYHAS